MNKDNSQMQYSQNNNSPYSPCSPSSQSQTMLSQTPTSLNYTPSTSLSQAPDTSIPSAPPPIYPPTQQGPPPVSSADYIPGFLASVIGRYIRAEFLVGSNTFLDKTGKLIEVGVNFFVLQDINSHTNVMCDLYSVRFVTILYM